MLLETGDLPSTSPLQHSKQYQWVLQGSRSAYTRAVMATAPNLKEGPEPHLDKVDPERNMADREQLKNDWVTGATHQVLDPMSQDPAPTPVHEQ